MQVVAALLCICVSGCINTLSAEGRLVREIPTYEEPGADCREIGPVWIESIFGGDADDAKRGARNKAAEMGATAIKFDQPMGGPHTSATYVLGRAYKCPGLEGSPCERKKDCAGNLQCRDRRCFFSND